MTDRKLAAQRHLRDALALLQAEQQQGQAPRARLEPVVRDLSRIAARLHHERSVLRRVDDSGAGDDPKDAA